MKKILVVLTCFVSVPAFAASDYQSKNRACDRYIEALVETSVDIGKMEVGIESARIYNMDIDGAIESLAVREDENEARKADVKKFCSRL